MPDHERHARLFRNGRNQAVRIPREFELPGNEVVIHKDGERLIIEPVVAKSGLLEVFSSLKPVEDEFPDVDEGLLLLDEDQKQRLAKINAICKKFDALSVLDDRSPDEMVGYNESGLFD